MLGIGGDREADMRVAVRFLVGLFAMSGTVIAPSAAAQEGRPGAFDPQFLMDQAVRRLAERYKLDAEQQDLARDIVGKHGKAFFEKHGEELKALQAEGMKLRFAGEEDPEQVRALAKRFKVVFDDARKILEQSGDEFDTILDEEQAKQHATDRQNMRDGFRKAEEEFARTMESGVTPWTRAKLAGGDAADPRRRMRWSGEGLVEREWAVYIEAVANHYKFDETQRRRADESLELAKKDAVEYRKSREKAIRTVVDAYRRFREAQADPKLPAGEKARIDEELKRVDADAAELEKPLEAMFAELRKAVENIATEEQRRKAGPFARGRR